MKPFHLAKMSARVVLIVLAIWSSCLPTGAANVVDATPVAPDQFGMPAREKEFIAIFMDARRQFASETRAAKRSALQISLEERIAQFMRGGQDVHDWVGVVRNHGMVDREHAWVEIEIAPDVVLSTLRSLPQDRGYETVIPTYSPMSIVLNRDILMGQAVMFDASMLIFDVVDEHNSVERSKLIARFWKLRPIAEPARR